MQDLSNIHDYATERVNNTGGDASPILEITPDNGLFLTILNQAARGSAPGVPIYLDLRDSNDDPLPIGTSVRFEYQRPSDEQRNRVSEVRDNIQPYNNLDITEQQDEEFIDAVKIPLRGKALNVRDIDSFYVSIESSVEVDWSNSQLYIEGSVVNESPKN
ncbi:hypothetical protein EXE53_15410 [Halorubrum sp. SD626R]|uniref:hypothetical protein n=1 Tax=Halorubrum sp. SD626R TaxID=1419722 RepID=UPI0010F63B6A|nr:hypothetical protein [Halorubrum sp. SD626R]TKX79550.1 hypothetical protein EXE53_15410 [Halorubrum sp. SD626R]